MRRDWIWAWVGAVTAIVLTVVGIGSAGIFADSPGMAVSLMLVLTMICSTGIVWVANQNSLRKIKRSGGEIELVIRPADALARFATLFPFMFGVNVLLRLLVNGPAMDWALLIISSAVTAYLLSLTNTAYKKPKSERQPVDQQATP